MALKEEFRNQGQFFFRWRSYFPLIFACFMVLVVLSETRWPGARPAPERTLAALFVSFLGLALRVYTIGHVPARTSGRNTKKQLAEKLNTTGLYSVVRHPLYLGNYFAGLGIVLFTGVWWLTVVYTLVFYLYYERIMVAEEEFLMCRFNETFQRWSDDTPAFWPRLSGFVRPELPFCFRTVLKREYPGFLASILSFALLDAAMSYSNAHIWKVRPFLAILLSGCVVLCLALRFLKKQTRVLHVSGR